jgi:hypothetical protein
MLDKLKFDTGDDPQAAKLKVAATIWNQNEKETELSVSGEWNDWKLFEENPNDARHHCKKFCSVTQLKGTWNGQTQTAIKCGGLPGKFIRLFRARSRKYLSRDSAGGTAKQGVIVRFLPLRAITILKRDLRFFENEEILKYIYCLELQ